VWRKRRDAGGQDSRPDRHGKHGALGRQGGPVKRGVLSRLFARRVDPRPMDSVRSATVPEAILLPDDQMLHEGRSDGAMPSIFCSRCSRPNPDTSRFCSNCGAPLIRGAAVKSVTETTSMISLNSANLGDVDAGEELAIDYAALEALPPDAALLIVTRGPNVGSRFLLDDDFTSAGRHADSDIFLDDVTVSRRHAEFYRQGGRFTVRDVGSLNGTYVNRDRIEEAELFGGDEVQIGKFRLRFLTRSPEVGRGRGSGGVQGYA